MREACARISKPMMANMADGGKTPIRSKAELADIGYKLAIFPSATGLAAAAAAANALHGPQDRGHVEFAQPAALQFCRIQLADRLRRGLGLRAALGAARQKLAAE